MTDHALIRDHYLLPVSNRPMNVVLCELVPLPHMLWFLIGLFLLDVCSDSFLFQIPPDCLLMNLHSIV